MQKYFLILLLFVSNVNAQITSFLWHGDTLFCLNPSTGLLVQVSNKTIPFTSVTAKPTTVSGYGLTDAVVSTSIINGSGVTSGTTGTMTVNMSNSAFTITPSGACTFNASGGIAGQRITFIITTSGTSSFVLTWGTNFKTVGTLTTGTTSGKVFCVSFICKDGTTWCETGRTTAM